MHLYVCTCMYTGIVDFLFFIGNLVIQVATLSYIALTSVKKSCDTGGG